MKDIGSLQPEKKALPGLASIILGSVSFFSLLIPNLYGILIGPICGIAGIIAARKQQKVSKDSSILVGLITSIIGLACWGLVVIILVVLIIRAYA
jgi:hypothetical protein